MLRVVELMAIEPWAWMVMTSLPPGQNPARQPAETPSPYFVENRRYGSILAVALGLQFVLQEKDELTHDTTAKEHTSRRVLAGLA